MKCVVLQNADGGHLGFSLFHPDLGHASGDCVFMVAPAQAELFDSPAAKLLIERSDAGESGWKVVSREPLCVVVSTPGVAAELFIELDAGAGGEWGVGGGPSRQSVGRAMLAQPRAGGKE